VGIFCHVLRCYSSSVCLAALLICEVGSWRLLEPGMGQDVLQLGALLGIRLKKTLDQVVSFFGDSVLEVKLVFDDLLLGLEWNFAEEHVIQKNSERPNCGSSELAVIILFFVNDTLALVWLSFDKLSIRVGTVPSVIVFACEPLWRVEFGSA